MVVGAIVLNLYWPCLRGSPRLGCKVEPWWPVCHEFISGNSLLVHARVRLRAMTILYNFA